MDENLEHAMRGPDHRATQRARDLRKVDNDAEQRLWSELRGRRLNGLKFVRQLPIGPYFADFACRQVHLVVEVDGHQHAGSDHDRVRDRYMAEKGWSVVLFWNGCAIQESRSVLETIVAIADGRLNEEVNSLDLRFVVGAPSRSDHL